MVKPLSIVLVLVAGLSLALVACSGGSGSSSIDVMKTYRDASNRFDTAKMIELTCTADQNDVGATVALLKASGIKTEDISGLKYEEKVVSADKVIVHSYGPGKLTLNGMPLENTIDENMPLVKENGQWKVCPSAQSLCGNVSSDSATSSIGLGDTAHFCMSNFRNGEVVPVAINEAALDEIVKYISANDYFDYIEMIHNGTVFLVEIGQEVKVIDVKGRHWEIVIQGGQSEGKSAWVVPEFLQP